MRKHEIALVVSGNAHNRTRAITCDDVVRNENGHLLSVDGVDCVCAGHYAGLFASGRKSVDFGSFRTLFFVFFNRRLLLLCDDLIDERAFGSENDVGHAEYGVRSCGEHFERQIFADHLELHFSAETSSYPVLLHEFGLFGPIEFVDAIEKFIGVRGDFEKPLIEILVSDLTAASFAHATLRLFVGKNGVAGRTPVDGCFLAIGKTVLVELKEHPLRPLVVVGKTSLYLIIPIVHCADAFELRFHRGNVFESAFFGVDTRLYRVVFGRQTERVKAHGLKHFVALHTFESGKRVGRAVVVPVSGVEFRSRRIREHFETVVFFIHSRTVEFVKAGFFPDLLPFAFDLLIIHKRQALLRKYKIVIFSLIPYPSVVKRARAHYAPFCSIFLSFSFVRTAKKRQEKEKTKIFHPLSQSLLKM